METSLGILETKGFAAAISAAEKILENSSIDLLKIEKTGGGIISVFFKGETEQLKVAFEKGIQQARLVGEILALHISNQTSTKIEKIFFTDHKTTEIAAEKREPVKEKIIARKNKVDIEKIQAQKSVKAPKELPEFKQRIKSSKLLETTSTIQRLRQEALLSEKISKEINAEAKVREGKISSEINISKIENLNVHELRRLARNTNGFPIQGREISKANRKELVIYFKDLA
jgi:ethanolamine utilization protein EutM